jgi:hypothetical protein
MEVSGAIRIILHPSDVTKLRNTQTINCSCLVVFVARTVDTGCVKKVVPIEELP